jgi:hypothetical protein
VTAYNNYMAAFNKKKVHVVIRKAAPRQKGVQDLVGFLQEEAADAQ